MDQDKRDKAFADKMADMAKGILLGGSLGAIAAWFEIMPTGRAVGLGLMVGCLAGISFQRMRERRGGRK